jgi:hypothetical protein
MQVTLFIDLPLNLNLASDSVSLVVDSMPTSLIASVTFPAISQSQLWTANHSPSSSSASLPYLRPLSPVLVLLAGSSSLNISSDCNLWASGTHSTCKQRPVSIIYRASLHACHWLPRLLVQLACWWLAYLKGHVTLRFCGWANASYNRDDIRFWAVSAARCHDSDDIAVKRDFQPGALWIVSTVLFVSDSIQEDKPQLGYRSRVLCAVSLN